MITVTAALLVAFIPQDEGLLKEAWPKFVDAWKAIDAYKPDSDEGFLNDEYLAAIAKIHRAFESAALLSPGGEYVPNAIKALLRYRSRDLIGGGVFFTGGSTIRINRLRARFGMDAELKQTDPLTDLLALLKRPKAADAKSAEADLSATLRSLKALGIFSDETRSALRNRALRLIQALVQGESFPEPPGLPEELAKRCRALISDLSHEEIVRREGALKELMRGDDGSLSLLRESLKGGNAEVVGAVRILLGYGHAPWKPMMKPSLVEIDDALMEPAK